MIHKKIGWLALSMAALFWVLNTCYLSEVARSEAALQAAQEQETPSEVDIMPIWGVSTLPVLSITLTEEQALTEKEFSAAQMTLDYPEQMLPEAVQESLVAAALPQEQGETTALDGQTTLDDAVQNINETTLSLAVRHRGNSTYDYDKKPYKIKLDAAADLLRADLNPEAESAATDWVLLANAVDETNLRNYYMFLMAASLESFAFSPEGIFVQVYFNEEYQGVYLLCEEVEVDAARLDIEDELINHNAVLMEQLGVRDQEYGFTVLYGEQEMIYDIRSEISSERQVIRAKQAIEAVNEAIASGDEEAIRAVIDLDSFVDMYLLQEFTMQADVGYGSFYLYIEANDDVVHLGPAWDFDRSLGYLQFSDGLYAATTESGEGGGKQEWFTDLMLQEWFQDLVRIRWNETKDQFVETMDIVLALETQYRDAFLENHALWFVTPGQSQAQWQEAYETQYVYLYYWTQSRYEWLDHYFNVVM